VPAVPILTILLIVPFWLLIIRPQQQRQRQHREFLTTLASGDRIEAFSGIHGTIVGVDEDTVQVEISSGVVVTMARPAVSCRVDARGRRLELGAGAGAREHDDGEPDDVEEPVNPVDPSQEGPR
jgi:preprotein translocase subunit YajC